MQKTVEGLLRDDYNLTNLIMQSPVAMALLHGENYTLQLINEKGLELAGMELEAIRDRPLLDVFPESREQGLDLILKEVFKTGKPFSASEYPIKLKKNGNREQGFMNLTFQALRNDNHKVIGIVGTGVDITTQVLAQKLISESERKFRGLFHSMQQGFCIIKMIFDSNNKPVDYIFMEANSAFYQLTPYKDVIGKSVREIARTNPDHWIDVYGKVALTGQEITEASDIASSLGKYFEIYAYPVGENLVAVLFTDISERRKNEESQKRFAEVLKSLVKQRTMELQRSNDDLQQFAHIASHDLKEPVRKITSYSGMILNDNIPEEMKMNFIRNIYKSGMRMANTIEDILKYSTTDHHFQDDFDDLDLNEVIEGIRQDLEMVITEKGAEFEIGELPVLRGSGILMYQLFYNLVANALKFSRPSARPKITIVSRNVLIDTKVFAEITVEDNGVGFEQKYAEKIFEKFSRLHPKDQFEGTGLGLALCRRIAERHSGTITARGIPNQGAVFTVLLPL